MVNRCVAVVAIGSNRAWWAPGAADDPLDGSSQLCRVGLVSDLDAVVEDDPVDVVDDLAL